MSERRNGKRETENQSSGNEPAGDAGALDPSGCSSGASPVLPVFGLALPKLPSVERALKEQRFMSDGLSGFPRQESSRGDLRKAVQAVLSMFDERKTFDDAPLEALRRLDLAALRPGRFEDVLRQQTRAGRRDEIDEFLRELDRVRWLVWGAVERWQQAALWAPSLEARKQALVRLRKFTGMLVPDTRGRGKQIGPPPTHLQLGYRQLLFRLNLARQLLDEAAPGNRVPQSALDAVSRESGLPVECIRDWLFFSDRLERKARALSPERMALELLGRVAGMGADSIATVISRGRRGRSGKRSAS